MYTLGSMLSPSGPPHPNHASQKNSLFKNLMFTELGGDSNNSISRWRRVMKLKLGGCIVGA